MNFSEFHSTAEPIMIGTCTGPTHWKITTRQWAETEYAKRFAQAQKPLPVDQAPVGEPVLGVWDKTDFCSCYLNSDGLWFDSSIADEDTADDLVPPNGWLPLPVLAEEEDSE